MHMIITFSEASACAIRCFACSPARRGNTRRQRRIQPPPRAGIAPDQTARQYPEYVPLGYDVRDRKLIINEAEAATVRMIFKRFVAIGSATKLAKALVAESVRTKSGRLAIAGRVHHRRHQWHRG